LLNAKEGEQNGSIDTGTKAPEFELKTLDGNEFSLSAELARGPVVLAFFKVPADLPYALPFLERLYKNYGAQGVTLVGVSQNDAKDTAAFNKQFASRSRCCSMTPAPIRSRTPRANECSTSSG